MEYIILIILVALLQYSFFVFKVGFSRGKYEVHAPKTVGNETWERYFRVQQNTMEQLIIFIPSILVFSMHVSEKWALLPGVLFIVGRQSYYFLYVKNPDSRGIGMILSFFSSLAMVIGSIIALSLHLIG